jgi:hypothetical protein
MTLPAGVQRGAPPGRRALTGAPGGLVVSDPGPPREPGCAIHAGGVTPPGPRPRGRERVAGAGRIPFRNIPPPRPRLPGTAADDVDTTSVSRSEPAPPRQPRRSPGGLAPPSASCRWGRRWPLRGPDSAAVGARPAAKGHGLSGSAFRRSSNPPGLFHHCSTRNAGQSPAAGPSACLIRSPPLQRPGPKRGRAPAPQGPASIGGMACRSMGGRPFASTCASSRRAWWIQRRSERRPRSF